ncbi:hypothetical protein EC973_001611 [Apophysomyces ossiformis]|uniref:MoaB/Mog domain-containing protein n=1 Tax=Apophysomyces ossiformis TaxID=679940 RepID=A0A8H7ETX3_9FUNG|nr:hypothetical protein EC973_001611 [Apophysomyces ossiformis]
MTLRTLSTVLGSKRLLLATTTTTTTIATTATTLRSLRAWKPNQKPLYNWRQQITMTTAAPEKTFTAACCIIGDEILNGKTRDSNAYFLAKYLFELGIDLKRVEVIADDYSAIQETICRLSSQHDIVFTSGGIGPTHDDITYDALAKAFGLSLKLDDETCRLMEATMMKSPGWKLTEARKRMALFPYPSKILRTPVSGLWVPVVVVNENIHVLPGIPHLFERLLESLRPHFQQLVEAKHGENGRYYRVQIATRLQEGKIAPFLSALQEKVRDKHIKIGSYPKWGTDAQGIRVVVSVVGKNEEVVRDTADQIARDIEGWTYTPEQTVKL